jgi:hypothetical protein
MGEARMVAGRFWHDKDIPIALGLLTQNSRISKPKTSSLIGLSPFILPVCSVCSRG